MAPFDNTANADQSAKDLQNFRVEDWYQLIMTANDPGVYNFFVEGFSITDAYINKRVSQTNYPCRPTIAKIVPPNDPSRDAMDINDYITKSNTSMSLYNMTILNVPAFNRLDGKTILDLPRFSNNDDNLCPLTYSLSSSNLTYSVYNALQTPVMFTYENGT